MIKFLLAQSSAKQEKSFPIESRVQGMRSSHTRDATISSRDKPQEAGDGFQQADKKNGLSMAITGTIKRFQFRDG